jgi:hypothetical protein
MHLLPHVAGDPVRSTRRLFAALVGLAALGVALVPPVLASDAQPMGCIPEYFYEWSNTSGSHKDMVSSVWGDGGITLGIAITQGTSTSATIGGSLETSESILIASAKETISASITQTITATVTYSGSWTVPANASWGELHAGATTYYSHWTYGHTTPSCTFQVTSSGTANMPYHVPSFWHVVHY